MWVPGYIQPEPESQFRLGSTGRLGEPFRAALWVDELAGCVCVEWVSCYCTYFPTA